MGQEGCQPGAFPLLGLPSELISHVVRALGCKASAAAACTCRLLRDARESMGTSPAFASAISASSSFDDAFKSACAKALEAIPGHVGFALVFSCGYSRRVTPSYLELLAEGVLPPGTPMLGCTGLGLIGTGEGGLPVEVDPAENASAVSVLLGYVPGLKSHLWAVTQPGPPPCFQPPNEAAIWMGGVDGTPAACFLFADAREGMFLGGSTNADPSSFVYTLQEALGNAVLVGGIPNSSGQIYHSAPMRGATAAGRSPRTRFAGLVLYRPASEEGPSGRASALALRGLSPLQPTWRAAQLARVPMSMDSANVVALHLDEVTMTGLIEELQEDPGLAGWVALRSERGGVPDPAVRVAAEIMDIDTDQQVIILEVHPEELRRVSGAKGIPEVLGEHADAASEAVSFQVLGCCPQASKRLLQEGIHALFVHGEVADGDKAAERGGTENAGEKGEQDEGEELDTAGLAAPAAAVAPAACSSVAGCVAVSCVGRGRSLFGTASEVGAEAEVLRQQAARLEGGQLPVAGVFCEGEIGPFAAGGDLGMQHSGDPERTRSCLQGYTSVYTVLCSSAGPA